MVVVGGGFGRERPPALGGFSTPSCSTLLLSSTASAFAAFAAFVAFSSASSFKAMAFAAAGLL